MQADVEKVSNLQRKIKVIIPAEQIDQEVENRLKQQAPKVKLKGFRPGKVPLHIIKQQFGDAIRQETIADLIRSTLFNAIEEQKLNVVGMPRIEPLQDNAPGQPLTFEAIFEIYPEVQIADFSGAKIEKLSSTITPADIDNVISKLQEQHKDWLDVSREVQNGDKVIIDFDGIMENKPLEGGSAKQVPIMIGSNSMIPGFESGLMGAKAQDTVELNISFPNPYPPKPELAGKAVTFKVKIHKIMAPQLPELNDQFAAKLDVKGGIAELRQEVQKSMERELARSTKENVKQQVLAELLKRNPIEVPNALIEGEIGQMKERMMQQLGMKDTTKIQKLPNDMFAAEAKQRVTLGLLLAELIKTEKLKVDKDRVRSVIEEIASAYDKPEEIINYYYHNKKQLQGVESLVLEEQAIEKLLEKAEVIEKQVSYDEAIKPRKEVNNEKQ